MEKVREVIEKAAAIMADPGQVEKIELPALKEVVQNVAATRDANNYYTKHSAHTKSSTKGCVMGCISG